MVCDGAVGGIAATITLLASVFVASAACWFLVYANGCAASPCGLRAVLAFETE